MPIMPEDKKLLYRGNYVVGRATSVRAAKTFNKLFAGKKSAKMPQYLKATSFSAGRGK